MTKSKRTKRAELAGHFSPIFKCPYCGSSMGVVDIKSMVCSNNHTFDFTKQGYVNFSTHLMKTHYNVELFEARREMIVERGLFAPLHESIRDILRHENASIILDAGCGEGSHLHRVSEHLSMTGFGLDISKEAIKMAAKFYEDHIWLVGDLANAPFKEQTFDVILNLLSPANYQEFKRILVREGTVIKVVPRPGHLQELREFFYPNPNRNPYRNDEIISLFKEHFRSVRTFPIHYQISLEPADIPSLVRMTPLMWLSKKETSKEIMNVTIQLEILIGKQGT